jgi:hypothetical protein
MLIPQPVRHQKKTKKRWPTDSRISLRSILRDNTQVVMGYQVNSDHEWVNKWSSGLINTRIAHWYKISKQMTTMFFKHTRLLPNVLGITFATHVPRWSQTYAYAETIIYETYLSCRKRSTLKFYLVRIESDHPIPKESKKDSLLHVR